MQTSTQPTTTQIKAALAITMAVAETIRELGEVPSGTLYATLMCKMDFQGYQSMLRNLEGARLVTIDNHLIRWTGPAFAPLTY